ncbi:tetratricopeptide repeat protein [Candidatus Thorarchaeota archaeon]|nr:MAG: tetratricopeptide repeat protein [Candidatus Thorarchaeota archaeon]
MSRKYVPSEFEIYRDDETIPWFSIFKDMEDMQKKGTDSFQAITDVVTKIATKESMKENPNEHVIAIGLHACLIRGRIAEALFMSTDSTDVGILSLRAIVMFVLFDVQGLRDILTILEDKVDEDSLSSDQVRLSTVRVLLAAAEQDTSVIVCVMEFDNLLEKYPEQVENPLVETMFTLYVVGTLLKEVGQVVRAARIADTLEGMAIKKNHRMFLALVENLRGHICNFKGDFEQGEQHYRKFMAISETLGFKLGIAMSLNNLGTLRLNALLLEEGLDYFKQSLELMDVEAGRTVALANLGEICTVLGVFDEAEKYLLEGIRLEEKTKRGVIELYTWYSIFLSKTGRFKESLDYLKNAERIATTSEKPMQKAAYLFAKGINESGKKKYDDAIATFEELLQFAKKEDVFEFLVRAELELASTYVRAYGDSRSTEHLSKAGYHLNDLIQIGKEQGIQALYAESLLARGDMFSIIGKQWESKRDIERALSVAKFIEDPRLEKEAKTRLDSIVEHSKIQKVDQSTVTKSLDRLSGFKPASSKMRDIPQPNLHALITLERGSGLPVFVHHFDEQLTMDSSLISGFISAINVFSDEIMGQGGLLRSINHEGFTVMIEHTELRIVTLIADKESFEIRYKLRSFVQRFNELFPRELSDEGIDPTEFQGAIEIINKIFLRASET